HAVVSRLQRIEKVVSEFQRLVEPRAGGDDVDKQLLVRFKCSPSSTLRLARKCSFAPRIRPWVPVTWRVSRGTRGLGVGRGLGTDGAGNSSVRDHTIGSPGCGSGSAGRFGALPTASFAQ